MRTDMQLLIFFCLATPPLAAEPPSCSVEESGTTKFEICERGDKNCPALVAEQVKAPSPKWRGCAWPARVYRAHSTSVGLDIFYTSVDVPASFSDSERMDVTLTFESAYCGAKTHSWKNVQIVVHDGFPIAKVSLVCGQMQSEVPAIDATEKGGSKTATHAYK